MNPSNSPQQSPQNSGLNQAPAADHGFFNRGFVRVATFLIIGLCVVVSVLGILLSVWDKLSSETLFRLLATTGTIAVATVLLAFMNVAFRRPGSP